MATNCTIIVKVKPEDFGEIKLFDKDMLPMPLAEWSMKCERAEESKSRAVFLKYSYIAVHCNGNGTLDGVGETLKSFDTYEKALNLVLGGNVSTMYEGYFRHYANRNEIPSWDDIAPVQDDDLQLLSKHFGKFQNLTFVFDDGWKYGEGNDTYNLKEY